MRERREKKKITLVDIHNLILPAGTGIPTVNTTPVRVILLPTLRVPTFAVMMIMITADIGTIEIQAPNMIIAAIIKMTTIMISSLAVTGPEKIRSATYSVTVYLSSKIMYALTIIMLVNLLTWNVRGIMSSAFTLSQLLSCYNTDIALITEHKLMPHSKCSFDSIHPSYASAVKISQQITPYSGASCGKAGVAIMYKKV